MSIPNHDAHVLKQEARRAKAAQISEVFNAYNAWDICDGFAPTKADSPLLDGQFAQSEHSTVFNQGRTAVMNRLSNRITTLISEYDAI